MINELIKLELIKYKENKYRIFSTLNGRKIFLKEIDEETYIYPDINIYFQLDKIYNYEDITKCYLEKRTIVKIIEGSLVIFSLSLLSSNICLLKTQPGTKIEVNDNYKRINYDMARTLSYQKDDIISILNNNENISNNEKKYIKSFISDIESYNVDLTIFKKNLKDLKIIKKDKNDYESNRLKESVAYFDVVEKTIFYKENLNIKTLYHELGHLLNHIYFEEENAIYIGNDKYKIGSSLDEGFISLFTSEIRNEQSKSYVKEQYCIKLLIEMLGSKTVVNCFLGEQSIVDELSQYDNKKEVKKILMIIDDVFKVSNEKNIDVKDKQLMIKKIMEWSIKSANKKYDELKMINENDFSLDQVYIDYLLNIDLMLSNAFDLNLEQIKEIEYEFIDMSRIAKKYGKILDDNSEYLIKLRLQLDSLENRKYFKNDILEPKTFEDIYDFYIQKQTKMLSYNTYVTDLK